MQSIVWILVFIAPVWWLLKRDFQKGVGAALALFALMPSTLALEVGGAFEFTFQRILLLVLVVYWGGWLSSGARKVPIPYLGGIIAWWGANVLALVFAVDKGNGLKWFLTFSTEIVLFYTIVSTTLTDLDNLMRAFRACCFSTAVIAVLGMIEYYTQFNPALDWMGIKEVKDVTDVIVTFRHRILFGYSMAMGWPLLLALAFRTERGKRKLMVGAAVLMAIGSCYFSGSRGPWFGAAIGGVVMYIFGSSQIRKSMRVFAALSLIVIIVRPGVRDTLVDLTRSTWDPDSYRGRSYYYRKELWPVAISLAKASPMHGLFGHGGLSTETMDLSDRFEYGGSTYHTGFSSWDQNYACDLVEFGVLGLGAELFFYAWVLITLYRATRECPPEYSDISAAILAAAIVYCFALTNVYMFSPQLKCLFFALVLIGTRLPALARERVRVEREQAERDLAADETVLEVEPA